MDLRTFSALSAKSECIMRLPSLRTETYVQYVVWGRVAEIRVSQANLFLVSKNLSQYLHCTKIISQIRMYLSHETCIIK